MTAYLDRSFNDFCRQFILPSDRLDVSNVTASYKSFRAYENDLRNLDDQFTRLADISTIYDHLAMLRRKKTLARYLEAELYYDHAKELVTEAEERLNSLKQVHLTEETRLAELDREIPELEQHIKALGASINATPEGQLYSELTKQQDRMNRNIGQLREIGSTLHSALAHRLQRAKAWANELKGLPVSFDASAVIAVENAIYAAEQNGVYVLDESLGNIAKAARTAMAEASNAARPVLTKLAEARKRIALLRGEIAALRLGRLPLPKLLSWDGESLVRFASCVLCGDSKSLESMAPIEREGELSGKLCGKLGRVLSEITGNSIRSLDDLGIVPTPRFVSLHGPLRFRFSNEWLDLSQLHGASRISQIDLDRADEIATETRRCITVENETTFHELVKLQSGELLIHTSFPGSATVALLKRLPPTWEFWHFGDSDEAGFEILRVLKERTQRAFKPLHMERGRERFEQESLGRPTNDKWPFYSCTCNFCRSRPFDK